MSKDLSKDEVVRESESEQTSDAAENAPAAEADLSDTASSPSEGNTDGKADVSDAADEENPFSAFDEPLTRRKEEVELSPKKKKQILLFSLLGAFVLLAALIVLLVFVFPAQKDEPDDSPETSDTTITILDKSKNNNLVISSAVLNLSGNTTVEFVNQKDSLFVKGYEDLPVHEINMTDLTAALTVFAASQDIGEIDDAAAFGFDQPTVTGSVTYTDKSSYAFEIGAFTPDQTGYYFREQGTTHVYVVPTAVAATIMQRPMDYISTTVFTEPEADNSNETSEVVLRDMSLGGTVRQGNDFSFRMVTSEDSDIYLYYSYIITKPYTTGTNSSYSTELAAFTQLSANSVAAVRPTAAELRELGLDDPYSTADFTLAVRTTTATTDASGETVSITKYSNLTTHSLRLARVSSDYYYLMIDDVPIVYMVASTSLPFASLQFDDLASSTLFLEDITKIGSMTVSTPDQSTVFHLAHDENDTSSKTNLTVTADGKTYDTMDFRHLMQVFMDINRFSSLNKDIEGKPLKFSLSYTRVGETQPVFIANFYEMSGNLYAAIINGNERYQVRASVVENAIQQYRNYLNGDTVLY